MSWDGKLFHEGDAFVSFTKVMLDAGDCRPSIDILGVSVTQKYSKQNAPSVQSH